MELSLPGILYSTLSGLILTGFYLLNKRSSIAGSPLLIIFWVFTWHIPVFALWAAIEQPLHFAPLYFLPGTIVLGLTIIGNILTIRAIGLSPFSLMVPILGLSPVFTSLISIPLLHEWPSSSQWVGIVLAVIGILCLYAPPERPWAIFSFWPSFIREKGALYMASAALIWALSAPMDRLALRQADAPFHALFVFIGFSITLFLWLFLRGEMKGPGIPRPFWPLLAATGAAGGLYYLTQLLALQYTPAGPFEAIKRVMSQFLALALGYFFFHEDLTKPKIIGIVILSVGVPLIVL